METDIQNQDTPEYREMQDMIANNQRELDAKTSRLSQERLDFLRTQGGENWEGGQIPKPILSKAEQITASAEKGISNSPKSASQALDQLRNGSLSGNIKDATKPLGGR
jgi:hypothetical protein